ncbi:MAG TPA: hypothetical protein VHD61_12280 [Lacunisphaera sp.]|nr:hypothetical protein [Lacunisphaera sp.]
MNPNPKRKVLLFATILAAFLLGSLVFAHWDEIREGFRIGYSGTPEARK